MRNREFGKFLETHKGVVTLQSLADVYGCSRAYMWDIVHGNVNPPQDYGKLSKIAECLNLTKKQKSEFFDKAKLKNDIPEDVKHYLLENPKIIDELRNRIKEKDL